MSSRARRRAAPTTRDLLTGSRCKTAESRRLVASLRRDDIAVIPSEEARSADGEASSHCVEIQDGRE
jgi:hypothetical protein